MEKPQIKSADIDQLPSSTPDVETISSNEVDSTRAQLRVALVYPEVYEIARFMEKRKEFPPFGVLYLAAVLEKNGIDVKVFKCKEGDAVVDFSEFDVVGFSVSSSVTYKSLLEARFSGIYSPRSLIAVGGVHASYYPEETLKDFQADVVAIGNATHNIIDIVSRNQTKDFSGIDGLCYSHKGKLIRQPEAKIDTSLEDLPFPARHLLDARDLVMTDRLANTNLRMVHIMITQGCPFSCKFCASRQKKVQYRSAENVRNELIELRETYEIQGFAIVDDNFTVNKKVLKEVCERIKDLGLYWSALSRVDTIDLESLGAMRDAGCIEIKFGVETANTELLKAMGKKTTKAQICSAIEAASSLGISVKIFLIHGFPGENMATTRETISLLEQVKQNIDRVSLFRFVPLPGSYVYSHPNEYILRISSDTDSWRNAHIYHNNQHWWGDEHDFQEMEKAYRELEKYIEQNWSERKA